MLMRSIAVAVFAVALAGCGGGSTVRVYRGTYAVTTSTGTTSWMDTTSGFTMQVIADATDPNRWTFDTEYLPVDGTLSGTTLNFAGGQSQTFTGQGSISTYALNNGAGTMGPDVLNVNLTMSNSHSGGASSSTTTYLLAFSGDRQ